MRFGEPTFAQRPGEPAQRASDAPLARRSVVPAGGLRLVELELEGLRVEVDLLLGLLPRQREAGDAVDRGQHVPLAQARRPRLAPGVDLKRRTSVETQYDLGFIGSNQIPLF